MGSNMLGARGVSALSALRAFFQNKEEEKQIIFYKSFRILYFFSLFLLLDSFILIPLPLSLARPELQPIITIGLISQPPVMILSSRILIHLNRGHGQRIRYISLTVEGKGGGKRGLNRESPGE